jgi:flagellar motor switch protein FliN/FliY
MDNQTNNQSARSFAGAFAESFAEFLTRAASEPWRLTVLDTPDLTSRRGKSVHFRLTLDGAIHGECFVEFCDPQITGLAAKIMGSPQAAFGDEQQEALASVISSAVEAAGPSFTSKDATLTCKVNRVEGLAFGGMFMVPLAAHGPEQPSMPVLLYFDGPLLASLSSRPFGRQAAAAEHSPIDLVNLKLVMDVELNVSLRFGQRQLPLREVLELASGSVIELDRQVDDPVELLLDGKVIARGEAVIVDGNYGLRVTEIPQPIASHFMH